MLGIDLTQNETWEYLKNKSNPLLELNYRVLDLSIYNLNEEFDLITSMGTFEHFADPQAMLEQILNLLMPGAYLYIKFFPVWNSKDGHYAYRNNQIPWFHLLFDQDVIAEYCELDKISYMIMENDHQKFGDNYMNCYSALDWHNLFTSQDNQYKLCSFKPIIDHSADWFLDIFNDYLTLPKIEYQTSGFYVVYQKTMN